MYTFHIALHALPPAELLRRPVVLGGETYQALVAPPGGMATPWDATFEQACEGLSRLGRMFVEPDGSFVWTAAAEPRWQVDGVLYDRDGRLLYVEINGRCPAERFDELLAALGRPAAGFAFQLLREAVYLDEGEFGRWAGTSAQLDAT